MFIPQNQQPRFKQQVPLPMRMMMPMSMMPLPMMTMTRSQMQAMEPQRTQQHHMMITGAQPQQHMQMQQHQPMMRSMQVPAMSVLISQQPPNLPKQKRNKMIEVDQMMSLLNPEADQHNRASNMF